MVKDLAMDKLERAGLKVVEENSIKSDVIDKKYPMDQHCYAIASKATIFSCQEIVVRWLDQRLGEKLFSDGHGDLFSGVHESRRTCMQQFSSWITSQSTLSSRGLFTSCTWSLMPGSSPSSADQAAAHTTHFLTSPPSTDGLQAPMAANSLKEGLHKPTLHDEGLQGQGRRQFQGSSSQAHFPRRWLAGANGGQQSQGWSSPAHLAREGLAGARFDDNFKDRLHKPTFHRMACRRQWRPAISRMVFTSLSMRIATSSWQISETVSRMVCASSPCTRGLASSWQSSATISRMVFRSLPSLR